MSEARFWRKVDVSGGPEACWPWQGCTNGRGYGISYFFGTNKKTVAHRVSYLLTHGRIDAGMQIDHTCRNRGCVNPAHLHQVTNKQNAENLGARRDSPTGIRGVTKRGDRFIVLVGSNYKRYCGGTFDTTEEAEAAAIALRNRLHTNNLLDRSA